MPTIDEAIRALIEESERLPLEACIGALHLQFRRLAQAGFVIREQTWLSAFELASIAKLVYIHGHGRRSQAFDLQFALNTYKDIWRLAESSNAYADNSEQIACFILRFVYQQMPFNIHRERMECNFRRTLALFSGQTEPAKRLRAAFETASGTPLDVFLKVAHILFGVFVRSSRVGEYELQSAIQQHFSPELTSRSIRVLAASRGGFRKYYEKYQAAAPWQFPYEFNPLLRFPVLLHSNQYWCVYPELINYAATRGLYFYLLDAMGNDFTNAFSDAFEDYVCQLCVRTFGKENVFTENDERELGWHGKTNDITVLVGDAALLFECKNSGLFALAKRSADPQSLATDARKNLVNSKHRQGLYQLHDKIASIRAGDLPAPLASRYAKIKHFYSVLLLHDEINFANHPECLKNIIDAELRANGINDFEYQIWHVEELENMFSVIPPDGIAAAIAEKFTSEKFRPLDLSTYLSLKTGATHLGVHLFMPVGQTKAWEILRNLSQRDEARGKEAE